MAVKVELTGFQEAERRLALLPIELRGNTIKSGLRTAGRVVVREAQARVPISDDDTDKHLRDTLGVVIREGRTIYAVVGPQYPAGAHGHLVEGAGGKDMHTINVRHHSHGRPTGKILRKQPFVGPAAEATHEEQLRAVHDAIERAVYRVMGHG